jgi:hypothetical protein
MAVTTRQSNLKFSTTTTKPAEAGNNVRRAKSGITTQASGSSQVTKRKSQRGTKVAKAKEATTIAATRSSSNNRNKKPAPAPPVSKVLELRRVLFRVQRQLAVGNLEAAKGVFEEEGVRRVLYGEERVRIERKFAGLE